MKIINPPNTLPRIDSLWAFLSRDPKTGNEGLCAAMLNSIFGPVFTPLVAADETRLTALMGAAEELARSQTSPIVLVRFTVREELRTITPPAKRGA